MASKKPRGWRAFDALTKLLIAVPKDEIEAQIEQGRRERKKRRRRKK